MENKLKPYDKFVEFNDIIRKNLKGKKEKNEVMSFIASEDFYFFHCKGYGEKVLNMFYENNILRRI
jgi:precorrin-2 dehydrogenase/sirohydrochlorin ferrochelatase